ncbi:hypothetical protein GON03_02580 [Nocardioides sp. MAH-18]|uniref:Exo-alpha-sialidase n=1 Tax=Nocardioides agri TaxID=2682843 RepID=A0A6L6XLU2_9ACTN|nr:MULTISPECIES: hypothetical protein [unclassified Nocardioides]MBA2953181.1 hypothetical protein [Nocardioides sp. CGMCC 1.13656]MVQ48050.1 hypothetical protein [Nocardioides sp. MAH-18]
MTDHTALLRQVADRADPTALPSPRAIRDAGRRRARRELVAWASAAVVAVAVVVGLVASGGGDRSQPAPVLPSPSPSPQPTPPGGWDRARIAPVEKGVEPNAVAAMGGRFVAAADTSVSRAVDGTDLPPLWWSDDGRTWHAATGGPAVPNAWDVAASDDVFVAVAPRGLRRSTAWYSSDGSSWQRADVPDAFHAFSMSSTAAGLFAWSETAVYTSADGHSWTEVTDLPRTARDGQVCFVHDLGDEVVLGAVDASDRPRGWSRRDGSWQPADADRPALGRWCRVHEAVAWTAEGPDTVISVLPYNGYGNTVFLRDR